MEKIPVMKYYSNGKVLLTGEYTVLFGSLSLAFPTRFGQDLTIEEADTGKTIEWKAYSSGDLWFQAEYAMGDFKILSTDSMERAVFLQRILRNVYTMNDGIFSNTRGYMVRTNTNFPVEWGLGTSSTLINNLSSMAGINPYQLNSCVTNGSGYDIACAGADSPIVYRKAPEGGPDYYQVTFNKPFLDHLFFVYSGKKKSTQGHISEFVRQHKKFEKEVKTINRITEEVLATNDLETFIKLIDEHEELIRSMLKVPRVQHDKFQEFHGVIKSLGAWGGDFMLAVTPGDITYVKSYFEQFGLLIIIPYKEMILH